MSNYEFSNAEKQKNGATAKNSLYDLLIGEYKNGFLKSIFPNYRVYKQGYSNSPFKAHYLIEFHDGTQWILYSTSSFRSDRLKENQWDALQCKAENNNITKAILICPDTIRKADLLSIGRVSENIENKVVFSAIDKIIIQDDLRLMIEKKATENMSAGKAKDIQGKAFEVRVADILQNRQNFEKWKNKDRAITGMNYSTFVEIVNLLKLSQDETETIIATADKKLIGKLPSGGDPKTDVLIVSLGTSDIRKNYTISCKRTSSNIVTVHQFPAETFAMVLDPNDKELLSLLQRFQECGGITQFGPENTSALTAKLKPLQKKLIFWVLGGIGGDGDPDIHWARYIALYDNNTDKVEISTIEEYAEKLSNCNGQFGTPFKWTYASGAKGKNIQLKCPIM